MFWVGDRLRKVANGRIEEIVGKRDSITTCDFRDLVLAVAIESSPMDVLVAFIVPFEIDDLALMPHKQGASYFAISQRDPNQRAGSAESYRCDYTVGRQRETRNYQLLSGSRHEHQICQRDQSRSVKRSAEVRV